MEAATSDSDATLVQTASISTWQYIMLDCKIRSSFSWRMRRGSRVSVSADHLPLMTVIRAAVGEAGSVGRTVTVAGYVRLRSPLMGQARLHRQALLRRASLRGGQSRAT